MLPFPPSAILGGGAQQLVLNVLPLMHCQGSKYCSWVTWNGLPWTNYSGQEMQHFHWSSLGHMLGVGLLPHTNQMFKSF